MEESKVLDPSMVDAGNSGRNNPHGDASRGNVTQAVTQIQRGDDYDQDWDAVVLNHVLIDVLDMDMLFNDTPAMDNGVPGHDGCTMMQRFYGLTSGTIHGFPMKSEKEVG